MFPLPNFAPISMNHVKNIVESRRAAHTCAKIKVLSVRRSGLNERACLNDKYSRRGGVPPKSAEDGGDFPAGLLLAFVYSCNVGRREGQRVFYASWGTPTARAEHRRARARASLARGSRSRSLLTLAKLLPGAALRGSLPHPELMSASFDADNRRPRRILRGESRATHRDGNSRSTSIRPALSALRSPLGVTDENVKSERETV